MDEPAGVKKDGWIWGSRQMGNMSEKELQAWEQESMWFFLRHFISMLDWIATDNRVQFFRAESDLDRAQESIERKHVEFECVIRSFETQREVWRALARDYSSSPGHMAYANERVDMFNTLQEDAEDKYKSCAIAFLRERSEETIVKRVVCWRKEEDKRVGVDR